jgi:hypothetical protein
VCVGYRQPNSAANVNTHVFAQPSGKRTSHLRLVNSSIGTDSKVRVEMTDATCMLLSR